MNTVSRIMLCSAILAVFLPLQSCVVHRPVRPGANFIWVAPYTNPHRVPIRGHWKYVGPPRSNMVWVVGHYDRRDRWVRGHWRKLHPPRKGARWVKGYRSSKGRWVEGCWRYR